MIQKHELIGKELIKRANAFQYVNIPDAAKNWSSEKDISKWVFATYMSLRKKELVYKTVNVYDFKLAVTWWSTYILYYKDIYNSIFNKK